jgi:hypothetical protein
MDNVFTISIIATVLFCFIKFVEIKFLDKETEMKPLKFFVRDALIVFISTGVACFVYFNMSGTIHDFMNTVTETKVLTTGATEVFTDAPGF